MRIFIADDNELVRRGVKAILASETRHQVCGEAADSAEALRLAGELLPDLILLDVRMPGSGGLEASRLIRRELPGTRIIIMTQYDPALLLPRAIEAGAQACIDKSRLASELLPAIESIGGSGL